MTSYLLKKFSLFIFSLFLVASLTFFLMHAIPGDPFTQDKAIPEEIMKAHNLTGNDVDYLVPHQANLRIIDACRERMGLDPSKVMINIDRYGNTTAATIPLCLSEWWQCGKLRRGHTLILSSFGAGYTWGAVLLKWSVNNPKKS